MDDSFATRVKRQFGLLGELLRDPAFGNGPSTFGSEVEAVLLDEHGCPARVNRDVIKAGLRAGLPITSELLNHQVELNGRVHAFAGQPFSDFADEFTGLVSRTNRIASTYGAQLGLMGMLPTLTRADLTARHISDNPRYATLDDGLMATYGPIRLRYPEHGFRLDSATVAVEGANTSLQVHWSVPTDRFALAYSCAQIATALAVPVSAGSPWLLGNDLWAENRIPVFEAATHGRAFFGSGWIKRPIDAFATCLQHPHLLPQLSDRPDTDLVELQLAHHTTYPWNRPVVNPAGEDAGLRIEFRALPSGPTVADMAANAAFMIGLTLALMDDPAVPGWIAVPGNFETVRRNFYAAARLGQSAALHWPVEGQTVKAVAADLALELLPQVARSLAKAGIDQYELRHLDVIHDRLTGQTADDWLRWAGHRALRSRDTAEAMSSLTRAYLALSQNGLGQPVGQWPGR